MIPLGSTAAPFALPDVVTGQTVTLDDIAGVRGTLVVFLCRHCPYVQHVKGELGRIADDYVPKGIGMVGISSNDADQYPDDSPTRLAEMVREEGWAFPVLYDESQSVAREYSAACTPDFFVFDEHRLLRYRGQLDDSRPNSGIPVTGAALRAALDAVAVGGPVPMDQHPSIGCSIKWK